MVQVRNFGQVPAVETLFAPKCEKCGNPAPYGPLCVTCHHHKLVEEDGFVECANYETCRNVVKPNFNGGVSYCRNCRQAHRAGQESRAFRQNPEMTTCRVCTDPVPARRDGRPATCLACRISDAVERAQKCGSAQAQELVTEAEKLFVDGKNREADSKVSEAYGLIIETEVEQSLGEIAYQESPEGREFAEQAVACFTDKAFQTARTLIYRSKDAERAFKVITGLKLEEDVEEASAFYDSATLAYQDGRYKDVLGLAEEVRHALREVVERRNRQEKMERSRKANANKKERSARDRDYREKQKGHNPSPPQGRSRRQ